MDPTKALISRVGRMCTIQGRVYELENDSIRLTPGVSVKAIAATTGNSESPTKDNSNDLKRPDPRVFLKAFKRIIVYAIKEATARK